MRTYLLIFAIVFSFAACKSKKETASTKAPEKTETGATGKLNGT